ncbi:MAG: RtcB family protein [Chloroflexota bacterium]
MTEQSLTGNDLLASGWEPGPALSTALDVAQRLLADNVDRADILRTLNAVQERPEAYLNDPLLHTLAERLIKLDALRGDLSVEAPDETIEQPIRSEPIPLHNWGVDLEADTLRQMNNATHLPIAQAAALMPDGHPGYGLPIGGVLATENSVLPYGVGMDIACRLRLSIFPEKPGLLQGQRDRFRNALRFNTRFGIGKRDGEWGPDEQRDHAILDDDRWRATALLRHQLDKAVRQLGTSGTSNHFAEWVALTVLEDVPSLGLQAGDSRLAFVTHSGSRGIGASIAQEYTRVAKSLHPNLPKQYQELAWLTLDSEAGQEYWLSMQLAGDFASACHRTIHDTVIDAVGLKPLATVENHHNFAWEEEHDGRRMIVHRKGATPAAAGVFGVIPGTMADKGYIVIGLGNAKSLNSSSHGAGRPRSRTASKQMITRSQRDKYLRERGVELLNPDAGVDEAPQAYKDPETVMNQQLDLVRPIATFMPLMVMMASDKAIKRGKGNNKGKQDRSKGYKGDRGNKRKGKRGRRR